MWFTYFWVLHSSKGGILIRIGKGGRQRTKWVVSCSYEIWGASWCTRVGEEGKSWGSNSLYEETWTKCSNSCFKKSQFKCFLGISQQMWRNWWEKSSTYSSSFIPKWLILPQTSRWLYFSKGWSSSLRKWWREWMKAGGNIWHH